MTPDNIESIVSNPETFCSFVYTPLEVAIAELENRQTLTSPATLPDIMKDKMSIVIFRHIATPNYELRRFMNIADVLHNFQPLILEYTDDLFSCHNEWKYTLGKIPFFRGVDKSGNPRIEYVGILDFPNANNKPISSLQTVWGESLVDFHHNMFLQTYPKFEKNIYDLSGWIGTNGRVAKEYYKNFLKFFVKDAILFDNFVLGDIEECEFTKSVIIPAIQEVYTETGYKPLIVALEPTEVEGDIFWLSHPYENRMEPKIKLDTHLRSQKNTAKL